MGYTQRRMVNFPNLTELKIDNYGLFPGKPQGSGIEWSFKPGLSLIAGINGIGKTTLLMMILRSFTGPYDLTGDGVPVTLNVVLPESPVQLALRNINFFAQRVADGAKTAEATLSVEFSGSNLKISRRLCDLFLERCYLNDEIVELPVNKVAREEKFQSILVGLMGLGSFVDVLLVLHHVILFHEIRPGTLWDPNAQRQLLRALCLDRNDASRVAELERSVQSADSQARNIHARITATERELRKVQMREAGAESVIAEIVAEQQILDAELTEASRLEIMLEQLNEKRKEIRLEFERSKIERGNAAGAIERLKYTGLFHLFPKMDDTTRLVISRIMSDDSCLVCNADAKEKRVELEHQIANGYCPACGAGPEFQDSITAPHEFEQAKLYKAREKLVLARSEEETKSQELQKFTTDYDMTIEKLSHIKQSIQERIRKNTHLRSKLPLSTTSSDYERTLKTLRTQHSEKEATRATKLQDLRFLLNNKESIITEKSNELIDTFENLTKALLVEDVRLVQVSAEPRYMQAPGSSDGRLRVPAYAAEMTAADRPGFVQRKDPNDVSESQRELVDLAFRLTLVKVFAGGNACTFVMETPEASLDGLAMERVGQALARFTRENGNRLVVTSNLTNTGIITALFGGAENSQQQVQNRLQKVLNLLQVAAPNRALLRDRERYENLLHEAISRSPDEPRP